MWIEFTKYKAKRHLIHSTTLLHRKNKALATSVNLSVCRTNQYNRQRLSSHTLHGKECMTMEKMEQKLLAQLIIAITLSIYQYSFSTKIQQSYPPTNIVSLHTNHLNIHNGHHCIHLST
jgi:hypothetical protein